MHYSASCGKNANWQTAVGKKKQSTNAQHPIWCLLFRDSWTQIGHIISTIVNKAFLLVYK